MYIEVDLKFVAALKRVCGTPTVVCRLNLPLGSFLAYYKVNGVRDRAIPAVTTPPSSCNSGISTYFHVKANFSHHETQRGIRPNVTSQACTTTGNKLRGLSPKENYTDIATALVGEGSANFCS
jgi:hypothetical protein